MRRYLLDTNVFDALAKGAIQASDLPSDGQLCATTVQLAELENTKDTHTRVRLSSLFQEIITGNSNICPAFVFGVDGAGFGQGEWREDGGVWMALKQNLDERWELTRRAKKKKNSSKENNAQDATIAEAAFHNGCILITCDTDLAVVARKHSIETILLKLHT
jgi:predicted nucleic acid-binding protein